MGSVTDPVTILVVDDEEAIRGLAAQVLESRGYEVLLAADSGSALSLAGDYPSPIHVLLTDVMMPQGNGIALASALLENRPDTRVLYMSGFESETIELVQAGDRPAGRLLPKPFTPAQLVEAIEDTIRGGHLEGVAPVRSKSARLARTGSATSVASPVAPRTQPPEAVYKLESEARCPHCGETILTLKAIRLLRTHVNFISTLPRRGRIAVCPECLGIVPAELTNF